MEAHEATTHYEAPEIRVLGTVAALTELQNKQLGPTDGFLFNNSPITNASP